MWNLTWPGNTKNRKLQPERVAKIQCSTHSQPLFFHSNILTYSTRQQYICSTFSDIAIGDMQRVRKMCHHFSILSKLIDYHYKKHNQIIAETAGSEVIADLGDFGMSKPSVLISTPSETGLICNVHHRGDCAQPQHTTDAHLKPNTAAPPLNRLCSSAVWPRRQRMPNTPVRQGNLSALRWSALHR